jgi:hypothetical protein
MPHVACVMMQKDEAILLAPWLTYHGHLFGHENLYVIDNGSTDPGVLETLRRFEAMGVHVDYSHATRDDYLNKGDVVGAAIRALDAQGHYDFFFPTDCDEFIIKQVDGGFSCDRDTIHGYLDTLRDEPQTLRMRYQLDNHPLLADCYVHAGSSKTFFARDCFGWTDHGHHCDGSRKAAGSRFTALLHAHFHHMPFERLRQAARQRWIGEVDIDDREKLIGYQGDSAHLARYLLMTADEYYGQFAAKVLVHFPVLRALLHRLGAPLEIPRGDDERGMEDRGEQSRTMLYVPAPLRESDYFAANQDVAASGMGAMEHFFSFGFREGRRLAPPEPPPPPVPEPAPETEPAPTPRSGQRKRAPKKRATAARP